MLSPFLFVFSVISVIFSELWRMYETFKIKQRIKTEIKMNELKRSFKDATERARKIHDHLGENRREFPGNEGYYRGKS